MQLRHVLIATDFSDEASAAYVHGAALARMTGARVTVLTVDEALEQNVSERVSDANRLRLIEVTKVALERMEVRPTMQVHAGDAAEEISAFAREHQVDLVLMGRRGLRRIEGLILGRTVRRTLCRIEVPTMVVPPSGLPGYRRLLAAADFSRDSVLGLRASIDLAVRLNARVDVIHVFRIPVVSVYPEEPDTDESPSLDDLQCRLIQVVRDAGGIKGAERCQPTVTAGFSVAQTVVSAAAKSGATLITVPSGHRSGRDGLFGTTTESVLRLASVPVLVFPVRYLVARYNAEYVPGPPACGSTAQV